MKSSHKIEIYLGQPAYDLQSYLLIWLSEIVEFSIVTLWAQHVSGDNEMLLCLFGTVLEINGLTSTLCSFCKLKHLCFLTFPVGMKVHWPEAWIRFFTPMMLPDLLHFLYSFKIFNICNLFNFCQRIRFLIYLSQTISCDQIHTVIIFLSVTQKLIFVWLSEWTVYFKHLKYCHEYSGNKT